MDSISSIPVIGLQDPTIPILSRELLRNRDVGVVQICRQPTLLRLGLLPLDVLEFDVALLLLHRMWDELLVVLDEPTDVGLPVRPIQRQNERDWRYGEYLLEVVPIELGEVSN